MMKERTCASVAEVLRRLPIHEWDRDTRGSVIENLWQAIDPAIWQQDSELYDLAQTYFYQGGRHPPHPMPMFATDSEVLQFDDQHTNLRIMTWSEVAEFMAPHLAEQRKRDEQHQLKNELKEIQGS